MLPSVELVKNNALNAIGDIILFQIGYFVTRLIKESSLFKRHSQRVDAAEILAPNMGWFCFFLNCGQDFSFFGQYAS